MSFYNPEVYNIDALKPEDRARIRMYEVAIEDAMNKEFIIDDMILPWTHGDDESNISRLIREIAEKTIEAVGEYMETQKMELIVSMIDGYYVEEE